MSREMSGLFADQMSAGTNCLKSDNAIRSQGGIEITCNNHEGDSLSQKTQNN